MSETATAPAAAPATTAAPTETSAALGGASTTPPAAPPAATPPPQAPAGWTKDDGSFHENWHTRLPEDLRGEKSLHTQKTLEGMARTLVHQQKMIGADKLPLPPKNATPEELAKWDGWNKLGRPETPDGYDLKDAKPVREGAMYDTAIEKQFLPIAHKAGLTNHQLKEVISGYRELATADQPIESKKAALEHFQKEVASVEGPIAKAQLQKEYGQAFDKKMNDATQYIRGVLGEKADALIQKHQFDADFIRVMVTAAEANREHPRVDGKSVPINGALSPAEAKAELAQLMSEAAKDPKHPLNNKMDPMYATLNKKYLQLHEFITAGG